MFRSLAKSAVSGKQDIKGRVRAVLTNVHTGEQSIYLGHNIVTNDGDTYYAQMAAGEAPSDDFDGASAGIRLGTGVASPAKSDTDVGSFAASTSHALDASYEKTNSTSSSNSSGGVDIVTWKYSYTTSEGNTSSIAEGAVVDNKGTPTAALTHFKFAAAFNKTSSDTLKVYVNHTFNGT